MAKLGERIYNGKVECTSTYEQAYMEVRTKIINAKIDNKQEYNIRFEETALYGYWLDEWLRMKHLGVKDSTFIRYRNTVKNHIKPELGTCPIKKIGPSLIDEFISRKLQNGRIDGNGGLSPKSISDILVIIKESFKFAQMHGVDISYNFEKLSVKKTPHEMRVLSLTEEQQLLSVLIDEMDRYKLGVFICLYTGIRIGELCALQWKHVSFSDRTIKIEQTMQRLQCVNFNAENKTQIIITEPKSFSSLRTIPLPSFLLEVMKPFVSDFNAYILSGEPNSVIEPRTMQNKFKSYLITGNIKDANFHSLRHTFATKCVEAGFDIKSLSDILGHSSVKITLDKYVHPSMQLKRSNMEKLRPAKIQ